MRVLPLCLMSGSRPVPATFSASPSLNNLHRPGSLLPDDRRHQKSTTRRWNCRWADGGPAWLSGIDNFAGRGCGNGGRIATVVWFFDITACEGRRMTNGTAASQVPTKNVGAGAGPMNGYNAVQSGRPGQPSPNDADCAYRGEPACTSGFLRNEANFPGVMDVWIRNNDNRLKGARSQKTHWLRLAGLGSFGRAGEG